MSDNLHPETLDLILLAGGSGTKRQLATVDSLDAKAVQIFGAASVVIGLGGLGSSSEDSRVCSLLLLLALLAYAAAAIAAFCSLRTRGYRVTDDADEIWTRHWRDEPKGLKHAIAEDAASAYKENRTLLRGKAKTVRFLLGATSVEVALVTLALVWAAAY